MTASVTAPAVRAGAGCRAARAGCSRAQTAMEFRLLLRNGEQVGLTLVIPLLLLFFFNLPLLYSLGTPRRIDFVVPSIIALAVMSRGVHRPRHRHRLRAQVRGAQAARRDRAAPLGADRRQDAGGAAARARAGRADLRVRLRARLASARRPAAAPCCSSCSAPSPSAAWACCSPAPLRAEVTLAAANLIWLVLLFAGGIAIPLSQVPARRRATCCSTCRRRRCPTGCTRCCSTAPALPVRDAADAAGVGGARAARRGPVVPVGVSRASAPTPPPWLDGCWPRGLTGCAAPAGARLGRRQRRSSS